MGTAEADQQALCALLDAPAGPDFYGRVFGLCRTSGFAVLAMPGALAAVRAAFGRTEYAGGPDRCPHKTPVIYWLVARYIRLGTLTEDTAGEGWVNAHDLLRLASDAGCPSASKNLYVVTGKPEYLFLARDQGYPREDFNAFLKKTFSWQQLADAAADAHAALRAQQAQIDRMNDVCRAITSAP